MTMLIPNREEMLASSKKCGLEKARVKQIPPAPDAEDGVVGGMLERPPKLSPARKAHLPLFDFSLFNSCLA